MSAVDERRPAVGSDRLVLRGPQAGDALMLCDFAGDIGVSGMTEHLPHPFGVADAEACLARAAEVRGGAAFVIEHRQFGPIGMLKIRETASPVGGPARPELSYWIGRPFWNRGYGGEALDAALSWVKADWRRSVVWAGHFADNRAAGQVLCKAGFLYTGDVEVRGCAARDGAGVRTRMMVWLA